MGKELSMKQIYDYYNSVADSLVEFSKDREIGVRFRDGGFGKRPNVLLYSQDVLEMVKKGATSFHGSVERWRNPMGLKGVSRREYDSLRSGWDMVLDIDSNLDLQAAKLAVKRIKKFLDGYGINPSLKFSGSRGFHIMIPFEAFPKKVNFENTEKLYPRLPKVLASFIRERIEDNLMEDLKSIGPVSELVSQLDHYPDEATAFNFVEVEKDWGPRHLFRLPYSLNEKTWLVSVPLSFSDLDEFKKEDAVMDNIKPDKIKFRSKEGEASNLVVDAMDWFSKNKEEKEAKKKKRKGKITTKKIGEKLFSPCIKEILKGLPDGRKRSLFVLINYLSSLNWSWDEIKQKIWEWNEKNDPPLGENYIKTQLLWFERQNRSVLPPNCDNDTYYKSFGICKPDKKCKKIKNPVVYSLKK